MFTNWNYFYSITGSCAGALIGLQFVAMTVITNRNMSSTETTSAALATPTVALFAYVLLLSAVMTVPWTDLHLPAILWALIGLSGVIYKFITARRIKRQTEYQPVPEDWVFYIAIPVVAHIALIAAGIAALCNFHEAPFVVGLVTLALLFTGIHNAWDAVIYLMFVRHPNS